MDSAGKRWWEALAPPPLPQPKRRRGLRRKDKPGEAWPSGFGVPTDLDNAMVISAHWPVCTWSGETEQ